MIYTGQSGRAIKKRVRQCGTNIKINKNSLGNWPL